MELLAIPSYTRLIARVSFEYPSNATKLGLANAYLYLRSSATPLFMKRSGVNAYFYLHSSCRANFLHRSGVDAYFYLHSSCRANFLHRSGADASLILTSSTFGHIGS